MDQSTRFQPGQVIGPLSSAPFSNERIRRYASVSKDDNPIHLDRSTAQKAGFEREVAHGMLVMGVAHATLEAHWGTPTYVQHMETKFVAPMLVDERLQLRYTVIDVSPTDHQVELEVEGESVNGQTIITGRMTLSVSGE